MVSKEIKILVLFIKYKYHSGQAPVPICTRKLNPVILSQSLFFYSVYVRARTCVCMLGRRDGPWEVGIAESKNATLTTPLKRSSATLAATGYLSASFLS
jgi:hypothetical protein